MKTLTELLAASQLTARVYDANRKVTLLSDKEFQAFEQGDLAIEAPVLGHQWLAIALITEEQQNAGIWWIRLPLDELSKLAPNTLTLLLEELAGTINHNMSATKEEQRAPMDHCQFSYTPSDEKKAAVVTMEKLATKQPNNEQADAAIQWINGGCTDSSWRTLSVQALSDALIGANLSDSALTTLFKAGPEPVVQQAAQMLQHAQLGEMTRQRIADQADYSIWANMLANDLTQLPSDIVISLGNQFIHYRPKEAVFFLKAILEEIIDKQSHEAFCLVIQDLIKAPATRAQVWAVIRDPERSEALSIAIGKLFEKGS